MSALRARIMNILYLDTSQNVLTAGVLKGAENFPRSVDAGKNGHTRIILSEIDAALKEAGLDVSEIDAVAAVTGPGSFTGIRIGAATASALCRGTGAAKIAVTEFEIIAYNRAKAYAAVEAGRGNLYFAECEDGVPVRTGFIPAEEREGAEREHTFFFSPSGGRADTLARIAAEKAARGDFVTAFEPFYMRKSQAERNANEV